MAATLRFILSGNAREVQMPEMDRLSPRAARHEQDGITASLIPIIAKDAHALKDDREHWNRSAALEIVGGDEGLLNEMVQLFLVESPKLVAQMEQALIHNDPRLLELSAHCLKGELRYLAMPEACEVADKLEAAGGTGEMESTWDLLADLGSRLALLWTVVRENTAPGVPQGEENV
jgi:HPt (histidine-containing phosphotransfer) domain-containing protein